MTTDRPLSVRPNPDADEYVLPRAPLPWIRTIARLRGLCGPWLVAVLALAFLPMPMRAQPGGGIRTARRVAPETPPHAGEPRQADSEPSAEAPLDDEADGTDPGDASASKSNPPNLLVLRNGRLVEGRISQSAGGYVVDRPNGSLLVPFDRVSFEAEDRQDAYRKVRSRMPAKTAGSNLALARWCLTYDMFDEAENELREALEIEPYREDARTMLVRLEELRNPDRPLHRETPVPEPKTDDGFEVPAAESLGGFSKETGHEFATRIQPLLMNKCGNASCHGGREAANSFHLSFVRGASNRLSVERNLAAVLARIDRNAPEQSPLLVLSQGNHGGAKALFHGPKASEQFELLRDWVRRISTEQRERERALAARPGLPKPSAAASSVIPTAADHEPPTVAPAPVPDSEFAPPIITTARPVSEPQRFPAAPAGSGARPLTRAAEASRAADGEDTVRRILKEEQNDPFDPDEFNQAGPRD